MPDVPDVLCVPLIMQTTHDALDRGFMPFGISKLEQLHAVLTRGVKYQQLSTGASNSSQELIPLMQNTLYSTAYQCMIKEMSKNGSR